MNSRALICLAVAATFLSCVVAAGAREDNGQDRAGAQEAKRKDKANAQEMKRQDKASRVRSQSTASAPAAGVYPASARLQQMVDAASQEALRRFSAQGFQEKNLAVTIVDLSHPERPSQASFRGQEPIYPASVVKLFYLVATHRWLEDRKAQETEELRRALKDMIVDSSNDATHYIVDLLSGVSNGGELPPAEMKKWIEQRLRVERYFASLGYTNLVIRQKPWCEGPYGRERAFLGTKYENRNKLTTDATARLLSEIVLGRAVTRARSQQMMELLRRDYAGKSEDADDQAHGFTALALMPDSGARLWSKAGWTSTTRHDAAYIELPNGQRFVLVVFTTEQAREREIIPTIARHILKEMSSPQTAEGRQ